MKLPKKPNPKLTTRQKNDLMWRVYVLRGNYKGRGLMQLVLEAIKQEKEAFHNFTFPPCLEIPINR